MIRRKEPSRWSVLASVLILICGLGALSAAFVMLVRDAAPETPGNAVVDLRTAIQLGDEERVQSRVCSEALDSGRDRPFGYESLEGTGTYHGTGVTLEDGRDAVVFGDISIEGGLDFEVWAFELVREDRGWTVCRVRTPTTEELAEVADGRSFPPPTYRGSVCREDPSDPICPDD